MTGEEVEKPAPKKTKKAAAGDKAKKDGDAAATPAAKRQKPAEAKAKAAEAKAAKHGGGTCRLWQGARLADVCQHLGQASGAQLNEHVPLPHTQLAVCDC